MGVNPTIYCLENVTDYTEFERLCHDLMVLEGYPNIQPLGGFKDKGRDAIHVSASDGKTTIFAYSVREDWRAKLAEDAAKIRKHGHTCGRLVFVTTAEFTPSERDEVIGFIDKHYRWDLDLFGIERLRVLLEFKHPHVRANHPQIFDPAFLAAIDRVNHAEQRDHILIHYGQDERALAEWLARRLTSEGYLVWCEHLRSLGGERYPDDIDARDPKPYRLPGFPLLAFIPGQPGSHAPDRAIAWGISKQYRHFLIPLRTDLIPTDEMDQVTRQLAFLPFDKNWAEGLSLLLERLDAAGCQKILPNGQGITSQAFSGSGILSHNTETIISNCLRILHLPQKILRFTSELPVPADQLEELKQVWAFRDMHDGSYLSFHRPPEPATQTYRFMQSDSWPWHKKKEIKSILSVNLVSELIRKSIQVKCFQKGLRYCPETQMIYFPFGLAQGDKIKYKRPNNKQSWVSTTGERKYPKGKQDRYRYHLAPDFYVSRNLTTGFVVLLRVRVRITNTAGVPLPHRTLLSRRKHLCMNWWNEEWLSRVLAISQFLSDNDTISIGEEKTEQIVISSQLFTTTSTKGINEDALDPDFYKREDMIYLPDEEEEEGELEGDGTHE